MKNHIFSILVSLLLGINSNLSAQTPEDIILKDLPITFIGLDFSACKGVMLGCTSAEMVNNYIPSINNLLIAEPNKYNLNRAFDKTNITTDITETNKINKTLAADSFQVQQTSGVVPISESKQAEMIKKYDLSGKEGLALVYIVESLDKITSTGTYYAVFFNITDRKIIISHKYVGRAGGFGMRNFWSASFYSVIKFNADYPLRMRYLKK